MKIRVGIVGYGNLGKSVEQEVLKNPHYKLIAIFSRRLVTSKFGTLVEPYANYISYKNKIDVMLLCGGSKQDLEPQTEEIAHHFDCINTFDTHAKIAKHLQTLQKITAESHHRCLIACGWDPGLFSIIRALFYQIGGQQPFTFWGKGISMGHSDAIRQVEGVDDGVQFTVPNKEAVRLARQNKLDDTIPSHFRECYVVSSKSNTLKIEDDIKNIPNYFKGQPTTVSFVSKSELLKLKTKMIHKGVVISNFSNGTGSKFGLELKVQMSSNPEFTAKIMITYITAVKTLEKNKISGAFTPLDIPISLLFESRTSLIEKLC